MNGGGGSSAAAVGEYSAAKTSVWWDIENCQVPKGSDPHMIAQNISTALAEVGYRGAVSTISAYGDTNRIPHVVQHALNSTGISLNHVPAGVKDASDKKILVDMLFWAVDNPAPANYLLISGDRDFSNALHQLRLRRYNILLAHSPNVSQALVAAAKNVWLWNSLVAGGSPLQNSDTAQAGSASVNRSGSGTLQNAVSDTSEINQSSDSEGSQAGNQKNRTTAKVFKAKSQRRVTSQPNISRTSSSESVVGFQCHTNETSDNCNQKSDYVMQPGNNAPRSSPPIPNFAQPNSSCSSAPQTSSLTSNPGRPNQPAYMERKQNMEAPHQFFSASRPTTQSGPAHNINPPHRDHTRNNPHNFQYPPRPNDFPLPQATFPPNNMFRPNFEPHAQGFHPPPPPPQFHGPNRPSFTPTHPSNIPNFNQWDISEHPHPGTHNMPNFPHNTVSHSGQPFNTGSIHTRPFPNGPEFRPPLSRGVSNAGSFGQSGFPESSPVIHGQMGNILLALDALKKDKMAPTIENIADCIRYGEMSLKNFDVRTALNLALERELVVKHKLGNLILYIGKKDNMWKCVNPLDTSVKHPKTIWKDIQKYLSSSEGRDAIMASECRYHAATILKKLSCLENLVLGDILNVLSVITAVKKWIVPHKSGWKPLSFSLAQADPTGAVASN
ncbi:hypothetical protein QJS04_geneDACA004672 [Acorus gramineus]|uniref:NYN domain-containing protein n=1 Tax=Acorus gramineus TaxID=55184 RepID=A0AAV9BVS7_ACOGR|nr:hypothetical protein QJS04_geneDACA004672 [Acorus gramineus]